MIKVSDRNFRNTFDLVIACCGYESRARHLLDTIDFEGRTKLALGYGDHEILSFEDNRVAFEDAGFVVSRLSDVDLRTYLDSVFDELDSDAELNVLLDISCFTRSRLADIVTTLYMRGRVYLEVFYSLAEFSSANKNEPKNQFIGPVSDRLAGWTGDADRAVALVSGVGYEQLKALGIIECVDPFEYWLLFPVSPISRYDEEVRIANKLLLSETSQSNVIRYDVLDASSLLRKLFSLVGTLRAEYRCILMPLGPKVFAFAAMLVGCVYNDVSIWRASAGKFANPKDKQASNYYSRFALQIPRA